LLIRFKKYKYKSIFKKKIHLKAEGHETTIYSPDGSTQNALKDK